METELVRMLKYLSTTRSRQGIAYPDMKSFSSIFRNSFIRHAIASRLNAMVYSPSTAAPDQYHIWYYNSGTWEATKWNGVLAKKIPSDMWNYQEIIADLQPSLVIEFGTAYGGSALFFSSIMRPIRDRFRVLSVDIDFDRVSDKTKADPNIELLTMSSVDGRVAERIRELRQEFPGKVFAILDSDHRKKHVLAEMKMLRPLLRSGDYLVVEDSNINGHPVVPGWGPGPYEAILEYFELFPDDYKHDRERESKFGFTAAPNGFLIREG